MPLDQVDVDKQEKQMTFLEHLEDLRWHIVRSVVAVLFFTVIALIFYKFVFEEIIFALTKEDFPIYVFFCNFGHWLYDSDKLCIGTIELNTQNLKMTGQFMYLMTTSVIVGLILGAPYLLWELWRFIKPALKKAERKYTQGFVLITSALFFLGVAFGYFVLAPLSVNFFVNFSLSERITNHFTLQSYVGFVTTLTLASGLLFELPLLIYILAKLGVISSDFLKKYRRHSILVILILASFITPPDVLSQIILTIPVYGLYEVGIMVTKRIEIKHQEEFENKEEEKEE